MPSPTRETSMAPRDKDGHEHARSPHLDFVDELFRSGHIDAGKRDFLRRGLSATGADAQRIARPSSTGIRYSDAAARRAAAAGLVRQTAPGKTMIGCGAETVH